MTPAQLALIQEWDRARKVVAVAEGMERALRSQVVASMFGDYGDGSRNADIGNGYTLKNVNTTRYDLADNPAMRQLIRNFEQYAPTAEVGAALIKDKPRLSLTAYRKLPQWGKTLFDPFVTTTPQLPQLSIIPPRQ